MPAQSIDATLLSSPWHLLLKGGGKYAQDRKKAAVLEETLQITRKITVAPAVMTKNFAA
jgi:hypothetical protein